MVSPPASSSTPSPTEHLKISLTVDQTMRLRKVAQRYKLSVSPILQAAVIARSTIEYAVDWPPKLEDVYVSLWPVDARPALQDEYNQKPMLVATNLSQSIMYIGKRFQQQHQMSVNTKDDNNDTAAANDHSTYTKEQANHDITKLILALAKDANPGFMNMHSAQNRAALSKVLPDFVPALIKNIASGEVP